MCTLSPGERSLLWGYNSCSLLCHLCFIGKKSSLLVTTVSEIKYIWSWGPSSLFPGSLVQLEGVKRGTQGAMKTRDTFWPLTTLSKIKWKHALYLKECKCNFCATKEVGFFFHCHAIKRCLSFCIGMLTWFQITQSVHWGTLRWPSGILRKWWSQSFKYFSRSSVSRHHP